MKIEFETVPAMPRLVIVRAESYWPHHKLNYKNAFDSLPRSIHFCKKDLMDSVKFPPIFKGRDITFINLDKSYSEAGHVLIDLNYLGYQPADFFSLLAINAVDEGFCKRFPNITLRQEGCTTTDCYLGFNDTQTEGDLGLSKDRFFQFKNRWYACVPKGSN